MVSIQKSIRPSKSHACHTIDTQDALWQRTNKNMNATVAICGIAHAKNFSKDVFLQKMSQTNVWNTRAKHAYKVRIIPTNI